MEAFVTDMNLMFDNAKLYNADESQIYNDADTLQVLYPSHGPRSNWRKHLSRYPKKSRKSRMQIILIVVLQDQLLPRAQWKVAGSGEVRKSRLDTLNPAVSVTKSVSQPPNFRTKLMVGDWVMLNNPNDPEKPIVAQIFKMWKTQT